MNPIHTSPHRPRFSRRSLTCLLTLVLSSGLFAAQTYLEEVGQGTGEVVGMATSASSGYTYILNNSEFTSGPGIISIIDSGGNVLKDALGNPVRVTLSGTFKATHIAAGRSTEGNDAIFVVATSTGFGVPLDIWKYVRNGAIIALDDYQDFTATGGNAVITDIAASNPPSGDADLFISGYYNAGTIDNKNANTFVGNVGSFVAQIDGKGFAKTWERSWGVQASSLELVVANTLVDPASRTAANPAGVERPWKQFAPNVEPQASHPTEKWPHHDFNPIGPPRKDYLVEDLSSSFTGDLYGRVIGIKSWNTGDGSIVLKPGNTLTFYGVFAWDLYESGNGVAWTQETAGFLDPSTGGSRPLRDGTGLGRMINDADGISGPNAVWGGWLDYSPTATALMPSWQLSQSLPNPKLAVDESGNVFVSSVSPTASFAAGSEITVTVDSDYDPSFGYFPRATGTGPFTFKINTSTYANDLKYRVSLPTLGLGLSAHGDLPLNGAYPYVLKFSSSGATENRIYTGPEVATTIARMGASGGSLFTLEQLSTRCSIRKIQTATLAPASGGGASFKLKTSGALTPVSLSVASADRGVFVSGQFSGSELEFTGTSGVPTTLSNLGTTTYFLGKLDPSLAWSQVKRAPNAPGPSNVNNAYLNWNPVSAKLNYSGAIANGAFTIGDPGTENSLGPFGNTAWGKFYTELNSNLEYAENIYLTVESVYGAPSDIKPHYGKQRAEENRAVTVSVPLHVYEDASGNPLVNPTDAQIESLAVTRHTVTGYTISAPDDPNVEAITGTGREVSFTLKRDTEVAFHWTTEYAITVASDLTGTGRALARWQLDDPAGTDVAEDSAGNDYPALVQGNVTFGAAGAAAHTKTAAQFDGIASHLRVPFNPDLSPASFSVAMWVKPGRTNDLQYLYNNRTDPAGNGGGASIFIYNGTWSLNSYATSNSNSINISGATVGAWTHLVGTFDAKTSTLSLWIDGVLAESGVVENARNTAGDLFVGAKNPTDAPFDGSIDDVLLFNRALIASEVARVMKRGESTTGLSSGASGNPSPETKKHWVEENGLFTAFIDGTVTDPDDYGTRYVVTGYRVSGSASDAGFVPFSSIETRQQVPQFVVDGAGTITYEWGVQHRVQVGTSSTASQGLPEIRVVSSPNPAMPQADRAGSGTFWFDLGTGLRVGGLPDVPHSLSLRDVLSATGALEGIGPNFQNDGNFKYHPIAALTEGATVVWDYGATIYRQAVSIGKPAALTVANPFGFDAIDVLTPGIISQINTALPPVVTALLDRPSPPAGSTAADMQVWDKVTRQSYPVRPGRFLLEWQKNDSSGGVIVTEITAGFPGDAIAHRAFEKRAALPVFPGARRDYRYLFHEAMPPVDLDPDKTDGTALLNLAYSSSATPARADGGSFSFSLPAGADAGSAVGRHVLVFSKAPSGATAVGDTTRETLAVKVLESRLWNGTSGWKPPTFVASTNDGARIYLPADGSHISQGIVKSNLNGASSEHVAIGDLDGDGDSDVVVDSGVFLNNGTDAPFEGVTASGFVIPQYENTSVDVTIYSIVLGDVDGDGDADMIVVTANFPDQLYRNNGSVTPFEGVTPSDLPGYLGNTFSGVLADVDGDGDLDYVAGTEVGCDLLVNDGNGNFAAAVSVSGSQWTSSVAVGDLDRDGDLDIVCGNAYTGPSNYFLNNGTATPFAGVSPGDFPTEDIESAVALADVDGNGTLDFVTEDFLYPNNGTAEPFLGVTKLALPGGDIGGFFGDAGFTLGDMDGDGDPDLLRGGNLYLNNGSATVFSSVAALEYEPPFQVSSVVLLPAIPVAETLIAPKTIGRKVASTADTAALGTGFVVTGETSRFNPQIYDRSLIAAAGPIIPVNKHFTGNAEDDLTVVWYERADGILWPYQAEHYPNVEWPTVSNVTTAPGGGGAPLDRIVIASRLGSEGMNDLLYNQASFDPQRYSDVTIYHQPDPAKPGYNPNEEHALIAPSLKFLDTANPPPTAFALRAGDLNVISQDEDYTSDPYVLVQFFDNVAQEWEMAVYSVAREDLAIAARELTVPGAQILSGGEISVTAPAHGFLEGEKVEVDFAGELQGLIHEGQYFVLATDSNTFKLSNSVGGAPLSVGGGSAPDVKIVRLHPHTFEYRMKAGEPVQPPYPLGVVIGLTPCEESFGRDGWGTGDPSPLPRTYWEDHRGQAWSVSGGNETMAGRLRGYFYYPMQLSFWFDHPLQAGTQVDLGTCIRFLPPDSADEFEETPADPRTIRYTSTWPADLPVLKVGETLTYAGGEHRADNPSAPGLPGVIGWASGRVVYDSLNPRMATGATDSPNAFENYAARLIAPLEEVTVPLALTDQQQAAISPATGITEVDGIRWRFAKLPASLKKRIFFDPVDGLLGIRGFVNDKTLGDPTLTAAPAPVYLLEPNILTRRDRSVLDRLQGITEESRISTIIGGSAWGNAVDLLLKKSRNPQDLASSTHSAAAPYFVGLEKDVTQQNGGDQLDPDTGNPFPLADTARHRNSFGPGLALVPSAEFLNPASPLQTGYVTLVENDDKDLGGPVGLHIIKIDKSKRYRGAVKTILSDNIFEEKITMRHTGDFGGNGDDIVYQWFYREEDGTADSAAGLPPASAWKLFPDQSDNTIKGLGMNQIDLEGTGGLILSDNLFFVRYRHRNDVPAAGVNGVNWDGTDWAANGQPEPPSKIGELWAGAGNSPTVDGAYKPQLAQGWIKRVLDRINPYEARFDDFRNNGAPATYVSMIQQAGQSFVGPVALNPDKDVIENVGLIELYQTILDRGIGLSIGLSQPITTPGVNNALQLAATRLSDLYMLLGNEAYADAEDPLVGYGTNSEEYGSAAPSIFPFQNQVASTLNEELALLRGMPESYGRPVFNRLFWNFTKSDGEVAYALNYNLSDVNLDGFVDEADAMIRYPQGHGDAWGHYTTSLKSHYDLLRHPFFNWQSRSERYNLLDVVIDVDFLDERKFAYAAAARAKTGAEIVQQTYRSRYVADPDGQWQGYTDTDSDRAWGVQGWARRAGQGALFDWMTANFVLPADDIEHTGVVNEAFKKIDRTTVGAISTISANLGKIQGTYDDANAGLNPLGLSDDVVPFDIDPNSYVAIGRAEDNILHFEQIYGRAVAALDNATAVFNYSAEQQNLIRAQQDNEDVFRAGVREQDRDLSNRLIEIFGSPYEGQIGTGKAYPAGYMGPDLFLWMYVDVADFVKGVSVAQLTDNGMSNFQANFATFKQAVGLIDDDYRSAKYPYFVNDIDLEDPSAPSGDTNVVIDMPLTADQYTFQAPAEWGQRGSPGSMQGTINDLLAAEADLALTLDNYDNYIKELKDMADLLEAKHGLAATTILVKERTRDQVRDLGAAIVSLTLIARGIKEAGEFSADISDAIQAGMPRVNGLSNDLTSINRAGVAFASRTGQALSRASAGALDAAAQYLEITKEREFFFGDIAIISEGYKFEILEALKEIEQHLRHDDAWRVDIFLHLQALRETSDQYRAELQKGLRLLDEREDFNQHVGGVTQEIRYQDMAYRNFRNDALQKYRAAFDLAARYAYLAAKAYDYETNLDPADPASAAAVAEEIIRARNLGVVNDGEPTHAGGGLADALATLRDNFAVLKGQLGINNPQNETGKFSLRAEHFRIKPSGTPVVPPESDPDELWRQVFADARVANLWEVPEFRRFCRSPQPESAGPIPGLVIRFGSEILEGKNFFGKSLAAGDNSYDATNYATKVLGAGVWFDGYDTSSLAAAPRVYLVPAGADIMTIPHDPDLATREWNVVDQAIPVPFPTGDTDLVDPSWIPAADSLDGPLAETRKFSRFRAFGNNSAAATADELAFDTRLVGRSAWNTNWILIIPGTTLLADGEAGLDEFVSQVRDIKLFFTTYGFSGN